MRFVVEQVALGQICLPLFLFCPVTIIATMFHTKFHLNTTLSRRTSGRKLGNFKQELWIEKYIVQACKV